MMSPTTDLLSDPELIRDFIANPAREILDCYWDDPNTDAADIQLLATAQQESDCCNRHQRLASGSFGTARSLWQIESPTCTSVVQKWAPLAACLNSIWIDPIADYGGEPHPWLAWCDLGAWWTARGILALDPVPLPLIGDEEAAWQCYLKNWRPGKPRPEAWPESYRIAMEVYGR